MKFKTFRASRAALLHFTALAGLLTNLGVAEAQQAVTQSRSQGQATPAERAGSIALDTIEVQGNGDATIGYHAPMVSTGTKVPILLRDVPQTVSVVTRQQLSDQNALSLQDALRYTPGVSMAMGDGQRDEVRIRGFNALADQYVDGLRDDSYYYRDTSNIERVEVLQGPASVLYGRGSPGGLVNRITKKPLAEPFNQVGVTLGSAGQRRAEFDLGTKSQNDFARFRITGAVEDSAGFRDQFFIKRQAIAPSLLLNLTPDTKLTIQGDYLHDGRLADMGIPSWNGRPAKVPYKTFYGSLAGDKQNKNTFDVGGVTVALDHRFNDALSFRSAFRFYDFALDRNYVTYRPPTGGNSPTVTLDLNHRTRHETGATWQNELTQKAAIFGMQHTLLYGVELSAQDKREQNFGRSGVATYSLFAPQLRFLPAISPAALPTTNAHNEFKTAGVYVQDLIELTSQVKVMLGGRFDWLGQKRNDKTANNVDLDRIDRTFSPRAGIIYQPWQPLSLYASYSQSFQPLADFSAFRRGADTSSPQRTEGYEVGAKYDINDKANLTFALFDMTQNHVQGADPLNPTFAIDIGTQRIRGLQLAVTGEIAPNWSVTGGYTYLEGEIKNRGDRGPDGRLVNGNTPALMPQHSANFWVKHQLPKGFYIAAGMHAESSRFASQYNITKLPGYVTFDLGAGYQDERWDITATVQNALNRRYYASALGTTENYNMPGTPLSFLVSARMKIF